MRRLRKLRILQVEGPSGRVVSLGLAASALQRCIGLAGLPGLPPGIAPVEGIVLTRCRSVHTLGMRFAIDVAFVTWPPDDNRPIVVRELALDVRANRMVSTPAGGPVAAIELCSGLAVELGLRRGGLLSVRSAAATS